MFYKPLLPLFLFSISVLPLAAPAAEDVEQARLVIEQSSEQIEKTLQQPAYQNDFAKATGFVDGIVTKFVDMPRVSMLVLGKNIRKSTPEQRRRFMEEFKILLVRTYTRAFLEYKEWKLTFKPYNDTKDDRKTIVRTLVHQPGKQPVNIHYRMLRNKKGEWKVYDIIIEGVSLVTNYRSTFNQEIAQTGSLEGVIETLVDKNKRANPKEEI